MALEANKAVIRRAINAVLNQGQLDLVSELFAEDLREHDPQQAVAETPQQAFINAVKMFRSAFPDNVMHIDAQIAEGDLVATRWTMTGTHRSEFMGIAASNRPVEVSGIFFDRLQEGKIAETWANYDLHGLLAQIRGDHAPGNE